MSNETVKSIEELKSMLSGINDFIIENNEDVKKSIEIFGLPHPAKKSSDSTDQFIGNLRIWYYGKDPYAEKRLDLFEEMQKYLLGSISGNPFRDGDLEVLNRFIKESKDRKKSDG
jgi:hypothetical protein